MNAKNPWDRPVDPSQFTKTRPVVELLDPIMAEVLRQKTGAERLQIAWGMWRSARDMLRGVIAREHRDWTETQVDAEVARRMSGGTC
jgi:hypothetical protein